MKSKRLIAVHLLNDWSGSPLVFRQALEALQQAGFEITLFTATPSGTGFLSDLTGVMVRPIHYQWYPTRLLTLWHYLRVQLSLLVNLLYFLRKGDCVYVNTLLPFGAAIAGWLRGCRIVYHIHEVSVSPWLLKSWLLFVANRTAQEALFVSAYTLRETGLSRPVCTLVYNALPTTFARKAAALPQPVMKTPFTALMLCSMKAYKGVYEFITLARVLPHIRFMLVLNAAETEVEAFRIRSAPPDNCFIYPAQTDTIPFYQQAHVVLNLSRSDAWVETFGMTILEAMACGRPVIVPTVGGICELIVDEREGYKVDTHVSLRIVQVLQRLSADIDLYNQMAQAARRRSVYFSAATFRQQITETFLQQDLSGSSFHRVENLSRIGNEKILEPSKIAS